jgi:hypothetical protein
MVFKHDRIIKIALLNLTKKLFIDIISLVKLLTKSFETIDIKGPGTPQFYFLFNGGIAMRSIGEVARLLNVHTQTLRNWERRGLIRPNRIGHVRVYSTFDLQRLRKIKDYSGRGIHIRGIKELLRLNGTEPAGKPENGGAA